MLIGTIKNPQILNIQELLISSNFLTGSCIRKCEIYQVVIALWNTFLCTANGGEDLVKKERCKCEGFSRVK